RRTCNRLDRFAVLAYGQTLPARLHRMRLLLAEDDRYLSAMLSKGLREQAYAVDVVSDGDSAIVQAAVNEYDVIVLDVMMPKRDGLAVCRELRRRGITAPVLM